MNKKGILIVLSGPSGTGKGTVLKELEKINSNVKISISATTRPPREGEADGREYFFMNKQKFSSLVSNDGMLEYAQYCGNYYGTPKETVNLWLNQGFDVILEIEVQGGKQIKNLCKDSVGIFILPPSLKELSARLINRNTNNEADIKNRLNTAIKEIKCAKDYDYTVVNDEVNKCALCICKIIESEKLKTKRNSIIDEVLSNE